MGRILLDPLVVLSPVSFAVHLAVFTELGEPVAVPLGWLWEEIGRKYSLLTTADVMAYHTDNISRSLDEKLYSEFYPTLHASAALLAIGSKNGLIQPVATGDVGYFLRRADWATYLADLVVQWDEVEPPASVYERADRVAAEAVTAEFGIDPQEVRAIFERNLEWLNRTPTEYPVYERFRILRIQLSQLYAFLEAGYDLSTPSGYTRNLVAGKLGRYGLVDTIENDNPMLPIVRKVAFDPRHFTVRDIFAMIEAKELLAKLGEADLILGNLRQLGSRKQFAKQLTLYLLGLVPILGSAASALGAIDLLLDARRFLSKGDDGASVLYCDVTSVRLTPHESS